MHNHLSQQADRDKKKRQTFDSGLEPRFQWNANGGYCGEVSFINVGLKLGQYISQWKARELAFPSKTRDHMQQGDPEAEAAPRKWKKYVPYYQLLLGVNDRMAAKNMHFRVKKITSKRGERPDQFLAKVERNVIRGHDAIIGVYYSDGNDSDYDHIVPILSVQTAKKADKGLISLSDHGLYSALAKQLGPDDSQTKYSYQYDLESFVRTRKQMYRKDAPIYALPKNPETKRNYGIVIKGIRGRRHLLPVHLNTNRNNEGIENGSGKQLTLKNKPDPIRLDLTATINVPNKYKEKQRALFMFDSFDKLPSGQDFSKGADYIEDNFNFVKQWRIPAADKNVHFMEDVVSIWSDQTAIFRAVPVL